MSVQLNAADTVFLKSSDGSPGLTKLTGRVEDFTGTELRLEVAGGRVVTYPGQRVERIETRQVAAHTQAGELFEQGQFAAAVTQYREAGRQETRPWMRRRLMAQLVWCYRALDKPVMAGETWLALFRSDPSTPFFDSIPLRWRTGVVEADVESRAVLWLSNEQPAVALMGASYLLSSTHRAAAIERLQNMISSSDARIVWLAKAQMWRTEFATATPQQLQSWQQTLDDMPVELRPGPYYVVGHALAYKKQPNEAVLELMRVPILYPQHRQLAALCLLEAAGQLKSSDPPAAARLYRELLNHYPQAVVADEARQQLDRLANP